jgi:hypothetical protein
MNPFLLDAGHVPPLMTAEDNLSLFVAQMESLALSIK